MANSYFNISYEFERKTIHDSIDKMKAGYICVADGTVMRYVHNNKEYYNAVNGALFSISDSSWTPVFLKWIYGIKVKPYTGPQLFIDIVNMKKYRMFFLGAKKEILERLKQNLVKIDPRIGDMMFMELPFCDVDEFDYKGIAQIINKDRPHVIWVSLGAPKQEFFMSKLSPYLESGILVAVGAAFIFYSNISGKQRAPKWIRNLRLEFLYRMIMEPQKQWGRFLNYLLVLPSIIHEELIKKHKGIETAS